MNEREELVLLTVAAHAGAAYGYAIKLDIEQFSGKKLALASIHTILYRLENDGLLSSQLGGSSEKRGGRSKRLYEITETGISVIQEIRVTREKIWAQIHTLDQRNPELSIQ
jgi:PadR family transcriptional regulator PadR